MRSLLLALLLTLTASANAGVIAPQTTSQKPLYTTYFYTAAEAVVHGYEKDTSVRIVSLEHKGQARVTSA